MTPIVSVDMKGLVMNKFLDIFSRYLLIKYSIAILFISRNSAHVEFHNDDNVILMNSLAKEGGSFVVEYELEKSEGAGEVVIDNG